MIFPQEKNFDVGPRNSFSRTVLIKKLTDAHVRNPGLVRLFEAEDELHLRLLVDTSASMATGGKLDQARRVAAALGFVALTRRDPVSLHRFPFDRPGPRFTGRGAVPALFAQLAALEAAGETAFARAATHLLGRPGPPGQWSSATC